jgi:hypothetical protein
MENIPARDPLTNRIIGLAIGVHRELVEKFIRMSPLMALRIPFRRLKLRAQVSLEKNNEMVI